MIEQLRTYTAFKEKPYLVAPIHTWHFTVPVSPALGASSNSSL